MSDDEEEPFEGLLDGAGCTEIWEKLSDHRRKQRGEQRAESDLEGEKE